jgi:cellulose biosynthesis protein BcsQ
VFRTEIVASRALEDAPAHSQTIFEFAPTSRAAHSFRHLAAETLTHLRRMNRIESRRHDPRET